MNNRTMIAVYCGDTMLFCTDSFPIIPNIGEIVTVYCNNSSKNYEVISRRYIYKTDKDKKQNETFVIIYVDKK